MIRVHTVLDTPAAQLSLYDHPPGEPHVDPPLELAPRHAISFVETGTFEVRAGKAAWQFAPGMLFVTTSGLEFTCTHAHECPSDRCLSVAFTAEAIEELQCAGLPAMRASARYESSRQRFLRHRMLTCRAGDEMRFELLAGALYQSLTGTDGRPVRRGGAAVTDVMRRIDRAAQLIEAEYARPLTLRQLADAAGMSAYHFSRVFHTLTGLPPHRYLTAVRLRHAVRLLDQGASVTHTCFEVGFVSLSHFTTAFRRRFGVLPSARRRGRRLLTLRAALANPLWSRRTSKAVSGER